MKFEKNLKSIQEAGNLAVLGNKTAKALNLRIKLKC